MANSTKGEFYNHIMLFWLPSAASAVVSLASLLLQIFIVAINVIDWLKERSMIPSDQIITSLSISRIFFHIVCLIEFLNNFPIKSVIPGELTAFLWKTSEFSSIWLSSLLSIFFFLKISTFQNIFFLRLKTIISHKIFCLIIVGSALSLVYAFMIVLFSMKPTQEYMSYPLQESQTKVWIYLDHVLNTISLLVFLASSVLLIISLGFHISKMSNFKNIMSSSNTFKRTIIFTAVSFLVNACFVILGMTYKVRFKSLGNNKWFILTWISLPLLHSAFLVYATTKIRNKFLTVVCCGKGSLFRR
uniref:Taste receptor type 2 n=1 Tax=Pyxicephalus adspersus TaxID=30357 RepID=A0AAV3AJY4_PYXAD|nr:TPA: hypothetical protein GDO54_009898 [Pyxicephalus adspersus]